MTRPPRGIEDDILRIEARVPGFGGLYLLDSVTLVTYLKDLQHEAVLRAVLTQFVSEQRPGIYNPLNTVTSIRVRQGTYAMSELIAWQTALSTLFGRIPGFVAIDADEAANRVTIGIVRMEIAHEIRQEAARLGIPAAALKFRVEEGVARRTATLHDQWRPTAGGIRIANPWYNCSLGFNGDLWGQRVLVSAAHCVNDPLGYTGATGTTYSQPGSGSPIGTVTVNPAWTVSDPSCGLYTLCTNSDALAVQYNTGITADFKVKLTPLASITVNGQNTVVAWVTPVTGLSLYKVGQGTGSSVGNVAATCENRVTTFAGLLGDAMNLCVDRVLAIFNSGDSGASVTSKLPNNEAALAGILVAGTPGASGYIMTNWGRISSVLGFIIPY